MKQKAELATPPRDGARRILPWAPHPTVLRLGAYCLLGITTLMAASLWSLFLLQIFTVDGRFDVSIIYDLELTQSPFLHGLSDGLGHLLDLGLLSKILGWQSLALILATATPIVVWGKLFRIEAETRREWTPALFATLPCSVGLIGFHVQLFSLFDALREAGLSSPGLLGIGVGEAAAPAVIGCLASIALCACYLVWRRFTRGPSSRHSNLAPRDRSMPPR